MAPVVPAGVVKKACLLYGCSSCWNYSCKEDACFIMAVVPAGVESKHLALWLEFLNWSYKKQACFITPAVVTAGVVKKMRAFMAVVPAGTTVIKQASFYGCSSCWCYSHKEDACFIWPVVPAGVESKHAF